MNKKKYLTWENADYYIRSNTEEISCSDRIFKNPILSVCIITYNHYQYIKQSIDSVLTQNTGYPFELIISDDNSNDGTTEIVIEYQKLYPERIKVLLSRDNLGKYTNNGRLSLIRTLKSARGKYLALLEGDDYWTDPNKLHKQINFLELHDTYSGCFHDTLVHRESHLEEDSELVPWREHEDKIDFKLEDIISLSTQIHTSSFMFRRTSILNLPEFILNTQSGDIPLFILTALNGNLRRFPQFMSVYRKHPMSMTNLPETQGYKLSIYRIQMYLWFLKYLNGIYSHKIEEVMHSHMVDAAKYFALSNNKLKLLKTIYDILSLINTIKFLYHISKLRLRKIKFIEY